MANATLHKSRICLYYWPWCFLFSLVLLAASIGVWIAFGSSSANSANDALGTLKVDTWYNTDRTRSQVVIVLAAVYVGIVVLLLAMTIARTAVEAKHDKTSERALGGELWMVLQVIFILMWWALVLWNIVVLAGIGAYLVGVSVLKEAIGEVLVMQDTMTTKPTWAGPPTPCPSQCLNLNMLSFIDNNDDNSCVCSYSQLQSAKDSLNDAQATGETSLGGCFFMCLAALCILTNIMCQFSHMKRELDYLDRLEKYNSAEHSDLPSPFPMPVEHGDAKATVIPDDASDKHVTSHLSAV